MMGGRANKVADVFLLFGFLLIGLLGCAQCVGLLPHRQGHRFLPLWDRVRVAESMRRGYPNRRVGIKRGANTRGKNVVGLLYPLLGRIAKARHSAHAKNRRVARLL